MKKTALLAVCILTMCIATLDCIAQCGGANNPWLQLQWRTSSSTFNFGHKVSGSNFNYTYSFGTVEDGLSAAQQIKIFNCHPSTQPASNVAGGSRFDIKVDYCTGSTSADWDVTDLVDFASTIPSIATMTASTPFDIIFHPAGTTPGTREALLTITYVDPDYSAGNNEPTVAAGSCTVTPAASNPATTLTIRLSGTVAVRQPLNTILVVDKSGSMGDPAYTMTGSVRKIDALQNAVSLFYDLLKDGTDKYGVVRFASVADPYVAFTTKSGSLPALLQASATTGSGGLFPNGSTSIGDGMTKGVVMSSANPPPAGHKNLLILQTDGIQNTLPDALTVIVPSNIKVYAVGLGPDVQDSYLQSISTAARFFKVDNDITVSPARQDLMNFYFKIFCQANNLSTVTDPTVLVDLAAGPRVAFTSTMTTADKTATFLVIEEPASREQYTVELINPKGDVITSATSIGGSPVEIISGSGYTVYRVNGAIDNTFVGEWKLKVTPKGDCKQVPCNVPVSFSSAAKSNLLMDIGARSETYLPGSAITITSRLTESRLPLINADVIATIKAPDDKMYGDIRLFDDGKGVDQFAGDGLYSAQFVQTQANGTYEIKLASRVKTLGGAITTREDVQFVSMLFPGKALEIPQQICMSCNFKWILAIVFIGLLILILWMLRRR